MTRAEFTEAIWQYCQAFDGSVTSWIRSPKRNQAVGGAGNSAHLTGLGCDVVCGVTNSPRREKAHALGLRLIVESDHDHLQPLDWTP